jgi:hypothetical protein
VTVPAARWTVHDVDGKWMVVDEEIRVHGHVTAIAGTFMSETEASKFARNLSVCPYAGKTVVLAVDEPEPEGWDSCAFARRARFEGKPLAGW